MKKSLWIVVGFTLLLGLGGSPASSCTTFVLRNNGKPLFARNFDYGIGGGMLVVNPRGLAKSAATFEAPAQWTSKYGSVTFNLYGRELPMGGMNEAGLVIECMSLEDTAYPVPDGRPTVCDLQWMQYQLDRSATVSEVIENASRVRPFGFGGSKIHFLVCDKNGGAAAVEFIGGKLVVHAGNDLPVPALTNSTYESSVAFYRKFDGNEKGETYLANDRTLGRFCVAAQAAEAVGKTPKEDGVSFAFDALRKASFEEWTRWSIVYDIAGKKIHFRTKDNPSIRTIDVAGLDFSCGSPPASTTSPRRERAISPGRSRTTASKRTRRS